MHASMPGSPVCIVKLLLPVLRFSDKLNDDDDGDDVFISLYSAVMCVSICAAS